uniref:Nuclease n=1 Tax=Agrobacterium tumefaciens TaxID=358 RepID=A0A2Z2PHW5_AGRTU|nr:thermonuclease family protein [Agrobacterium tumefaciens]ASK41711.1 nuclease [Agrobacterium tumefaciens]
MHRSMWVALLVVGFGVGGMLCFERTGGLDRTVALTSAPAEDTLPASFSICGEDRRMNCVVDGDTFWFKGEKIRIADIDTPELSPPRCTAERVKGEAAKARILALLNAGPFSMSTGLRDEDRYGRKLGTVSRKGQSFGEILVGEGLARRWDGARRSWCDS